MRPQIPNPTHIRSALFAAAALRGGAGDGGPRCRRSGSACGSAFDIGRPRRGGLDDPQSPGNAASVSPTPAISPQRHSAVIAPAHGHATPDRQHRFRWDARPGRGRRDVSVRARSPFADHLKT